MSSFQLDGVALESGRRWEVRVAARSFEVDVDTGAILRPSPSAGTWQSTGPRMEARRIALYVADAEELRELAAILTKAAAQVDTLAQDNKQNRED